MTRRRLSGTLIWALLVLVAAAVVTHATYTTDLSAFLPRRASPTQELLIEQLRSGPAVHLIMAEVYGGDARSRAKVSGQLAAALRADPAFAGVSNGDAAELDRDRAFLFAHRYLLSPDVTPPRFTVAGLRQAIGDSLDVLASPEGALAKALFTHDPTGEMLAIVAALGQGHTLHTAFGVWTSPDGKRAFLIAQTRAPGSDTDGQQAACEALRRHFDAARLQLAPAERAGVALEMSGPPVLAVRSRATIKSQVVRLSAVSAVLIAVLLLAVYRSGSALALTLVPVASGALAGVAAVALGFPAVHGITLGFGVTLIGEAVDYSIYLLIQNAGDFRQAVWPTLRLGVLTSICGFAALLPSTFPGLGQLGVYSITGLIAAALVTRFVLPGWLPRSLAIRDLAPTGGRLARAVDRLRAVRVVLLAVPLLAAVALLVRHGTIWSRELSTLSPTPAGEEALDERMRADSGAPDMRYVAIVSASDREAALEAAQTLDSRLTPLVDEGLIRGFESPARFLPPLAAQRMRQGSLPAPADLAARLQQALVGLPVSAARLEPFLHDVEAARTAPLLTPAGLEGTSFARAVQTLLIKRAGGWSALLPLSAGADELPAATLAQVRDAVTGAPGLKAQLLDVKGEADRLYSGYLREAVQLAVAGLGLILVLLLATLRSVSRVMRVMAPLVLAVLAVAGFFVLIGRPLTILHVVGMLLIVAVGSNYALFFDRRSAEPGGGSLPLTLASLLTANLATVIAFGVLAFSSVPLLADLGATVAPGTLLALLFSAAMSRPVTPGGAPPPGNTFPDGRLP